METSQTTIAMSSLSADAETVATWVFEIINNMLSNSSDEEIYSYSNLEYMDAIVDDFSIILSSKFTNNDEIISSIDDKRLFKYSNCYFTINLDICYGSNNDHVIYFKFNRFTNINDAWICYNQLDE